MNSSFANFWMIFADLVVPVFSGVVFLALARYVAHIAPMRTLVTGQLTYRGATWGFALAGIYLLMRPVQVLMGGHVLGLTINNLREFVMVGIFAPAVFIAMFSLCLGSENLPKFFSRTTLTLGVLIGAFFVYVNTSQVGGSEQLFSAQQMMESGPRTLFLIRLVSPVALLFIAGGLIFFHASHYPEFKKQVYNNMPKKLYFLGAAVYAFAIPLLISTYLYQKTGLPEAWRIYYLGTFLSGILETISLSLPLRREVQISEHL